METAQFTDLAAARRFVTAGKALFTLVSERTGARFTFKVKLAPKRDENDRDAWFVSVLTGPQNTSDYTYLGMLLENGRFIDDRKLRIGLDAPSRKAFRWFWARVNAGSDLHECQVWHEGRCGRCGRLLTVPESIESGLGPVCAGLAA